MRRRKAQEKVILADPKYNSKIIAKFMNMVMHDGKKAIAEKLVYSAFDIAQKSVDERHGLVVVTGSSAIVNEYWAYKGIKKIV